MYAYVLFVCVRYACGGTCTCIYECVRSMSSTHTRMHILYIVCTYVCVCVCTYVYVCIKCTHVCIKYVCIKYVRACVCVHSIWHRPRSVWCCAAISGKNLVVNVCVCFDIVCVGMCIHSHLHACTHTHTHTNNECNIAQITHNAHMHTCTHIQT